jgi:hypothetical protein
MRRLVVVLCLVLSGIGISSMASAATGPRGSVVLKTSALQKAGSTQCGKVNGSWISGKVTKIKSKNYFVSYTKSSQLYSADAKKYRGTQKKRLLNLSSDYKKKAATGNKKCSRFNVFITVETTVPVETTVLIPTTTTTTTAPVPQPLKFDIANAVGLALKSSVSSAGVRKLAGGSNLQKIDDSGKLSDALAEGNATIDRFLIAPNNKLYVLFSSKPVIGIAPCVLAEVDKGTGRPVCIEADQDFQFVPAGQSKSKFTNGSVGSFRNLLNDIQFDSAGAIYYLGTPGMKMTYPTLKCCTTFFGSTSSSVGAIVRKYHNGVKTDFGISYFEPGKVKEPGYTDKMDMFLMLRRGIFNFLVLPNGKVLVDQDLGLVASTDGGVCPFSRLDIWSPDGTRQAVKGLPRFNDTVPGGNCWIPFRASELGTDQEANYGEARAFLRLFGSSDVIVADYGNLFRIDSVTASATSTPYPRSTVCSGQNLSSLFDLKHYFCSDGTMWRGTWSAPNGDFYAIVGQDPGGSAPIPNWEEVGGRYGSGVLVKVWPDLAATPLGFELPKAVLTRVESFLPILDSVVASGTTPDGGTQTVLYNTATGSTKILVPTSAEIHPLKFSFNASAQKVLFSAAGMLGIIDLPSGKMVTVPMVGQLNDVQAFAS